PASGSQPILVLLHGTASSTAGSFGGLGSAAHRVALERLFHFYDDRVYALEHRTLSVSPIENAVDLVKALPERATVHLLSHSRGGLIGELVCRGNTPTGEAAFTDEDLAIFARAADESQGEPKRALEAQGR